MDDFFAATIALGTGFSPLEADRLHEMLNLLSAPLVKSPISGSSSSSVVVKGIAVENKDNQVGFEEGRNNVGEFPLEVMIRETIESASRDARREIEANEQKQKDKDKEKENGKSLSSVGMEGNVRFDLNTDKQQNDIKDIIPAPSGSRIDDEITDKKTRKKEGEGGRGTSVLDDFQSNEKEGDQEGAGVDVYGFLGRATRASRAFSRRLVGLFDTVQQRGEEMGVVGKGGEGG